jgi:hypothetical protein
MRQTTFLRLLERARDLDRRSLIAAVKRWAR